MSRSGYFYKVVNSNGTYSSTTVDFEDVFVKKYDFLDSNLYGWGALTQWATTVSSPVLINSPTDWRQINRGNVAKLLTRTDNTLWAWGDNSEGLLGLNNITSSSSPVQVGSLNYWYTVSNSNRHALAVRTDGTLWAWGRNEIGEMGNNSIPVSATSFTSSPVQVGSLTDWKQVEAAYQCSFSIKTDGTLWSWGANFDGALGLGDTTHRSSPVQVGSLNDWKFISAGNNSWAAIKTDGSLWTCGLNEGGALGLGDTTSRSSPVQVGSLKNWQKVSFGLFRGVAAVKNDNTLWVWGRNDLGALGLGDTTHRSSPVQVGSLTNWKDVSVGYQVTAATKYDGTLWVWGTNTNGELGLGNTTHRSSPVQVGSRQDWRYAVASYNQTYASINSQFEY